MSTRVEEQLRAEIVEAGRRLYARGYVASNDGNISARLDDSRLITTPKSVSKGFMTPGHDGDRRLRRQEALGDRDPSSELPMHLEIYRNRPDINAVVHAHPPLATGFAVAGIPLTRAVLAEVVTTLGQHPHRGVRHAVDRGIAGGRPQVHQGARRSAARQSRRGDVLSNGDDRVLQDGDDRALREDQPRRQAPRTRAPDFARGSRATAGASRMYGIAAPAPLCTDGSTASIDQVLCQVLEAPESATERLVPDVSASAAAGEQRRGNSANIRRTHGAHHGRRTESQRLKLPDPTPDSTDVMGVGRWALGVDGVEHG